MLLSQKDQFITAGLRTTKFKMAEFSEMKTDLKSKQVWFFVCQPLILQKDQKNCLDSLNTKSFCVDSILHKVDDQTKTLQYQLNCRDV